MEHKITYPYCALGGHGETFGSGLEEEEKEGGKGGGEGKEMGSLRVRRGVERREKKRRGEERIGKGESTLHIGVTADLIPLKI